MTGAIFSGVPALLQIVPRSSYPEEVVREACTRIGACLDNRLITHLLIGAVAVEKCANNHFIISNLRPQVKPIYLARQRSHNPSQPDSCVRRLPVVRWTGIRSAGHPFERAGQPFLS